MQQCLAAANCPSANAVTTNEPAQVQRSEVHGTGTALGELRFTLLGA